MDGYTAKGRRRYPAPPKNAKEKIVNFVEIKTGVLRSGCVSISCADDDCNDDCNDWQEAAVVRTFTECDGVVVAPVVVVMVVVSGVMMMMEEMAYSLSCLYF